MKTLLSISILLALSVGTWLLAQRPPPGPPEFYARPMTNAPAGATNAAPGMTASPEQVEEMLRALRRAMTNAPGGRTNAPGPSATATNAVTSPAASTAPGTNVITPSFPALPTTPPAASNTNVQAAPTLPATNVTAQPQAGVPTIMAPQPAVPVPALLIPGAAAPRPGVAAPQPTQAESEPLIPQAIIQVQGMPLDQFFEIYSMISGRTVLRPYQLTAKSQQITLKAQNDWTKQEAIYAMDAALALNGIAMIPVDEKFVKAVPAAEAGAEGGAELAKLTPGQVGEADQFVTQIVELKTVKPSELAQLLASFSKIPNSITPFDHNNTLVLREHASNVKRMMEVIQKVDVMKESDYKLEVIPIKYGKVGDLYNTMASLISGQAGAGFGGATGTSRTAGRQGSRLGQSGSSAFGQQGYRQPGQTLQPQQAATPQSAGAAQGSFQQRLQQIVSRAAQGEQVEILQDAKIVADERSNNLLIFANKRDIEMITNIVAKVDVLLAQVLIEAVIMEVQLRDSHTMGVSMLQNPRRFGADFTGAGGGVNNGQQFLGNITNLASGLPSGFSYFGNVGGELDVAVAAIARDSSVNVVSRPRIHTSHAIPANFTVAETVPFISGSYDSYSYGGFGGGLGNRSIVERVDVGVTIGVTPFITPEGLVVMEIAQEANQRGADVIIDGNPIPIVNKRQADAVLTVRTGQAIMIGGFITESKNKSKSGVPILKDIPLLGNLFRSKAQSNDRSELIILIRATVLQSPEDAAALAEREKSELPGVYQAEREFRESDQKRLKKSQNSRWQLGKGTGKRK